MIERIALILLLNIIFFSKSITYKYSSDDIPVSMRQKKGPVWRQRLRQIIGTYRFNPQEDHAITMAIHALVCSFIYLAFGANDTSFLAALLFSFNPSNNQGSVWISGRGYVLPALLILIALSFPLISPVALTGAAYFHAGFLSSVLVIGSSSPILACFLPLAWAVNWRRFTRSVSKKVTQEMFPEDKKVHIGRVIVAIKTIGFYFLNTIIPVKTTFYHSFMQSAAGSGKEKAYAKDRYFWIGVITLSGIGIYWLCFTWNIVSFGLFWFLCGIAPFSNLVRMSQECAERYMYLPGIGLMVALAAILSPYPLVAAFFIGMYASRLWFYMDAYQDDYYLAEHSRLNSPDSWFAWHVAGMKRWDTGSYKEALIMWTMAKMISPKEMKVLMNIATCLKLCGHVKEAEAFMEEAMKHIPQGQEGEAQKLYDGWKAGKMAVLL